MVLNLKRFTLKIISCVMFFFAYANPASAMSCDVTVFSEPELNDAIACFNSGTENATIVLGASIEASSALNVIASGSSSEFKLDGDGNVISMSASEGSLFEIQSGTLSIVDTTIATSPEAAILASGTAVVVFYNSTISLSASGISLGFGSPQVTIEKSLILNSSQNAISAEGGTVMVIDSTINGSRQSSVLMNNGTLSIQNSTISDGNSSGVYIGGGTAAIKQSTISGNRLNGVDVNGGQVLISNSTVSDNRIGVNASRGFTSVAASTIGFNRDNSIEADGGQIRVQSSLVIKKTQAGPYSDCVQFSGSIQFVGKIGSSFNSDGTCVSFSVGNALNTTVFPDTDALILADTGCSRQHATPSGMSCVKVHDLLPTSIAKNAGDCSSASGPPQIPAVTVDQIGGSRTSSCDTGAVTATDASPPPPGEVAIYSPYDGDISSSKNLYLEWSEDSNLVATHYRVILKASGQTIALHDQLYALSQLEDYGSVFAKYLQLGLSSGTYQIWIRGENSVGVGPYKMSLFEVIGSPVAPILNVSNGSSLSGTGLVGATVTLKENNGKVLGTTLVAIDGSWSFTPSIAINHGVEISAVQRDSFGNVSVESNTIKVDSMNPIAPVLNASDGSSIGGSGEVGATITLTDSNEAVLGTTVVDADGSWELILTEALNHNLQISAIQSDASGNTSVKSNIILVDIISPLAPVLTASNGSRIGGSGEVGATITLTDSNEAVLGTTVVDADGSWELILAEALNHNLQISAFQSDASGNASVKSNIILVDSISPLAPVVISSDGSNVSGTGEPGATITLTDRNEKVLGTAVVSENGSWRLTFKTAIGHNTEISASQRDVAGNVSVASNTITVENGLSGTVLSGGGSIDLLEWIFVLTLLVVIVRIRNRRLLIEFPNQINHGFNGFIDGKSTL